MPTTPPLPSVPPIPTMRPPVPGPPVPDPEQQHLEQSIKRIRDQNGFRLHLVAYLAVSALLVLVWATTGAAYFWPIFVLVGWGAGVAVHGYCVYRGNGKYAFRLHLVAYLVINAGFVVTWAVTEPGYFFWPILVILAWGAGVAIHGYAVYGGKRTDAHIARERKWLP
jgi:2TM domain